MTDKERLMALEKTVSTLVDTVTTLKRDLADAHNVLEKYFMDDFMRQVDKPRLERIIIATITNFFGINPFTVIHQDKKKPGRRPAATPHELKEAIVREWTVALFRYYFQHFDDSFHLLNQVFNNGISGKAYTSAGHLLLRVRDAEAEERETWMELTRSIREQCESSNIYLEWQS